MKSRSRIISFVGFFFFFTTIFSSNILPKIDGISFCIADLKFDGKMIKILEFGDGAESMFAGHDALYGCGTIWKEFWKDLSGYGIPIWFVGNNSRSLGVDVLEEHGGSCVQSVARLIPLLKSDMNLRGINDPKNYKGIVFIKRPHQELAISGVSKMYPNLIVVNKKVHMHVANKQRTNFLFQGDSFLEQFRPACLVYPKKYSNRLASSIIESFDREVYVIKPTDSSRGRGVVFSTKQELDQTLKILFSDKIALSEMSRVCPFSFGFWQAHRGKNFLVEEYVPSKIVTPRNGKSYDATMRLVFTAHSVDKKIETHILGAYWKLPSKSLSDSGSLTEKHRSNIHNTSNLGSFKVSKQDLKKVLELFCPMVEKIYKKMLDS